MSRLLGQSVTLVAALHTEGVATTATMHEAASKDPASHTLYFEDHETVPQTIDEVEEFIAKHADEKPVLAEIAVEEAAKMDPGADKHAQVMAVLDAIKASEDKDAVQWAKERLQ